MWEVRSWWLGQHLPGSWGQNSRWSAGIFRCVLGAKRRNDRYRENNGTNWTRWSQDSAANQHKESAGGQGKKFIKAIESTFESLLRIPVRVFRKLLHQRCDLRLGWSVEDSLTKLHAMFAIFSLKLLKISPWAWGCNPKNWRQRVNVYRCNLTISPNRSLSVPYFCVFFFVLFRKLFTRQMQTLITASGLGFLVRQPIIIGMVQVSSEDESSGITKLRNPRCNLR